MLIVFCVIDASNQLHLRKLHEEYEKVCQDCLEKVDYIKVHMKYLHVIVLCNELA